MFFFSFSAKHLTPQRRPHVFSKMLMRRETIQLLPHTVTMTQNHWLIAAAQSGPLGLELRCNIPPYQHEDSFWHSKYLSAYVCLSVCVYVYFCVSLCVFCWTWTASSSVSLTRPGVVRPNHHSKCEITLIWDHSQYKSLCTCGFFFKGLAAWEPVHPGLLLLIWSHEQPVATWLLST